MAIPFAQPFLQGDNRATALLRDAFRRPAEWAAEVRARASQRIAPELCAVLRRQQAALPPSEARQKNLDALDQPGTTVVVTGQQVGLFLGPLYTFYKAASAIAWARAVEAQTGARCVPLFWLQTEDHDFAEICGCTVAARAGALSLALPDLGLRCSVAHLALPPQIDGLVARLADELAPLPFADAVLPMVRAAYRPGKLMAQAFAELLGGVFAEEGLVVLDPRCPEVSRLALPINELALLRAPEVDAALEQRGHALREAGLREQVKVRPGSPLVFFHPEGVEGPRHRLRFDGDRFEVDGGGEISREALLSAVRREPLLLSTSALLRPLVQDALLPAVAYVGGPGELGYLAQAAALYPLFGVRPALAAVRARFRLIDPRTARLLRELGLTPAEVEAPRDQLLQRLAAQGEGAEPPEELARALLGDLPGRIEALAAGQPSLDRAVRRTRLSVERALGRFAGRLARSRAEKDATLAARVDRLQASLYPHAEPQERVHALPSYAALFGLPALKAAVLAAVKPGDSTVQDLTP